MGVILSNQAEIYQNNGSCAEQPAYVGLLDGLAGRLRGVDMSDAQLRVYTSKGELGQHPAGCQGG